MKREREDEESFDEDSVSSNESMMSEEGEDIQVDFEVNEPNFKTDYHGIETYTQLMLNGEEFEYAPLIDLIMGDAEKQIPNPLTSVVKVPYERITTAPNPDEEVDLRDWEWDEDTYGVMSLLSFEDKHVQNSIGKWMIEACDRTADQSVTNRIRNYLNGKHGPLGLLVNLHVVNQPFELSCKLHQNLWYEYKELLAKNQVQKYNNIVLITSVFLPKVKKHFNKKKRPTHANAIYPKYEETFYAKYATFAHRYTLLTSESFANNEVSMLDKSTGDRFGLIMVIPTTEISKIILELEQTLSQPTQ